MHDHAGNGGQAMRVGDQLIVGVEKAAIDKVVALDAGKGQRVVILGEAANPLAIREKRQRLAFPSAPCACGFKLHRGVVMGETPVIGGDHVVPLRLRNDVAVTLEGVWKDPAATVLVEPFELGAA